MARHGCYVRAVPHLYEIRRVPPFFKGRSEGCEMTAGIKQAHKATMKATPRKLRTDAGGNARGALFGAVYRREVQQLADLAEQLKDKPDPLDALRQWMRSNVRFVATKKGMSEALALAAYKNSELFSS